MEQTITCQKQNNNFFYSILLDKGHKFTNITYLKYFAFFFRNETDVQNQLIGEEIPQGEFF